MTARSGRRPIRKGWTSVCAIAVVLSFVAPRPARAREPTPAPTPTGMTETVQVRLVELLLLVLDHEQRPVLDLDAGDLALSVDGSPREIGYVRPGIPAPAPDEVLPRVRLGIETGAPDEGAATGERVPRYYLVFLDLTNEHLPKGSGIHEAIARFLNEGVADDDFVAVMSYTGGAYLDLPFTSERDRQLEAVTRALERPSPGAMSARQRVASTTRMLEQCNHVWDSPVLAGEELQEFLSAGEDRPVAEAGCVRAVAASFLSDMNSHGQRFLAAIEAAIRFAGTVRDGATVLAISHGVSLQPALELQETYHSVFGPGQIWKIMDGTTADARAGDALQQLIDMGVGRGVSVSFLDPSRPPTGSRGARGRHLIAAGTNPVDAAYRAPHTELRQIATATGGVFVADTDLVEGLRRVTQRERGRYVLGFYADRPLSESELRKIRVVARRPGLTVESGRAYDVRRRSSDWAPGTFVHGESRALGDEREGRFISFRLHARQADLDYVRDGEAVVADLSLNVRVLTADGRPLIDTYRFFHHATPAEPESSGKTPVLSVRGWLEADPGLYRIEAMFRNPRSGKEVLIFHEFEVSGSAPGARLEP